MDTTYNFLKITSTQKKITIASNKIDDRNFLEFKFPESEYYIPLEFHNMLFSKVIETGKFGNQRIYDFNKKGFDGLVLLSLRFRVEIEKVVTSDDTHEEKTKAFHIFCYDLIQYLKIYCTQNPNIIFEDSRENTKSIPSHIACCIDDIFSTFELSYLPNYEKEELGEEVVNFVVDKPFLVDVDPKLITKYFSPVGLFEWEESFVKEKLNSKDTFNWFFLGGVLPLGNTVNVSEDLYHSLYSRFIDETPLTEISDTQKILPPKLKMGGSLEKKKRFIANLTFIAGYYQTILELANNITSPILITESDQRQVWKDLISFKVKMDKEIEKLNLTSRSHLTEIITLNRNLILNKENLKSDFKNIAREVNYTYTWHLYQFLLKEGGFIFNSKKSSTYYDALGHAVSEVYAIIKLGNTIGASTKEDKDQKSANWDPEEWNNTKKVIRNWVLRYEKDYQ